jgi:hypothetical protein
LTAGEAIVKGRATMTEEGRQSTLAWLEWPYEDAVAVGYVDRTPWGRIVDWCKLVWLRCLVKVL